MTISLPESLQAWVEEQASKVGKSPDEYVLDILRAVQARESDPDAWLREVIADELGEEAITPELLERCRNAIEVKLIEGLNSGPAIEVNVAFWQERRRKVEERLRQRHSA
jgi:Arc/MetJ-type ribon-helix-helix transcriptional regulator